MMARKRVVAKLGSWELRDSKRLEAADRISEGRTRKTRGKCEERAGNKLVKEPGLEDAVV